MKPRILILGCGYVGRAFAIEALAAGFEVVAVTRNLETVAALNELGCNAISAQVESDSWHAPAAGTFDFAVNCVSSAGNGLDGYRQSYVEGNRSFVTWLKRNQTKRAVFTSSVSVYSDSDGNWVDEGDAAPSNERGSILVEAEKVLLDAEIEGLSKGILRLGGIYGPERHMLLNRSKSGPKEIPGVGNYFLNLIRLEDICSSLWAVKNAENLGEKSIFNVIDDEPVLKADLINWFADELGYERPKFVEGLPSRNSSRRFANEPAAPSNRRIRNDALKLACGWSPRFPSYREGFAAFLK